MWCVFCCKMWLAILYFGLSSLCGVVTSSRILVIMPMPMQSHANLFHALVQEMAARGHQITYITSFPLKKPPENVDHVLLPNLYQTMIEIMDNKNDILNTRHQSLIRKLMMVPKIGPFMSDKLLEEPSVKSLIASQSSFDLILGEAHLDEAVLAGMSQRFKAPFIGLSTFIANPWSNYMVGNLAPASYIPDPLLELGPTMSFMDRLHNALWSTATEAMIVWSGIPAHEEVLRKHFGNDLPPLAEIIKNASVVFVNHHHSLAFPRPYLPNMIEIGGFHVKPPQQLPKDLKKYMDESQKGVILFSLGSHIKSTQMGQEKKQAFLSAFSQLKENVLWKFEDDSLTNVPNNVKISKWLPQSDLLGHPNVKLFITHGGLLSTTEAVHRGVPIVGIPLIGDQPVNMRLIESFGIGKTLNFDEISKKTVLGIIRQVLDNPQYRERAKERSAILRDTPMSAMDTAMYWVEYVIRHRGAPHLRSGVQDLAWYQLHLLDVVAAVFLATALILLTLFYIVKLVLIRLCYRRSSKTSRHKKER